jgi:hypothetical protein
MEHAGYWFREVAVPPAPEPAATEAPTDPVEPVKLRFEGMSEAEKHAIMYPDRAARIRAAGGLPAHCEFGPPEPTLVAALVSNTSLILRVLDQLAHALV